MTASDGYRVGIDLVEVDQVAEAIARFGPRYLDRIFTSHELECARRGGALDPSALAARFAAKEATLKVLRPTGAQPDWRTMELQRQPSGHCEMALTSTAATMAEAEGITSLAVSVTHEASMAASVVVAKCQVNSSAVERTNQIRTGDVTVMERNEMDAAIRGILRDFGRLSIDPEELGDRDDLFDAGMTSHASVNVMLELEDTFDIEFPESMLRKQTFESVRAIADAVGSLAGSEVAC